MDDDEKLYMEQMKYWFAEQATLDEQLQRTIKDFEKLADLNRQQLKLHRERIELGKKDYQAWLKENEIMRREIDEY